MKLIHLIFNSWINPILIFIATAVLLVISSFSSHRSLYLQDIASYLFFLGMGILLISFCMQLYKKEWQKSTISFVILVGGSIVSLLLYFILITGINMIDGDHWADDLKIPKDIPIENPIGHLGSGRPDSMLNIIKSKPDIVLYNAGQPGMYEFDIWTMIDEDGQLYLKAFEITTGEQLSPESLAESSNITVRNTHGSILKFSREYFFTIYEGDWGKYYAARFEVWFKPYSKNPERKLFEKNFKIEGWMH